MGDGDFAALRWDIDDLRIRLETYLSEQTKVPEDRDYQIEQTLGLTRVLQRAAIHVQSSGKKEMDAGDFLAAAMREPESFAVYVLSQQGVTRLDILEFISHGISKIDEKPAYEVPARRGARGGGRRRRRRR